MSAPRPRRARARREPADEGSPAERFRQADAYRARREWLRYEGTGQRDLYRELRERFLARHAVDTGWAVDIGSGPGRFLPSVGGPRTRKVAIDLSLEMLRRVPEAWRLARALGTAPERIRGDATRPPLALGSFAEVVLLGNTLGFAGRGADDLLAGSLGLVGPGGTALLEIAPAPGERSQYLARLPASALARLFRAPLRVIVDRLDREPFREETARHTTPRSFRRFRVEELHARLGVEGFDLRETIAVAPALGPDSERISAVRTDAKAWSRLLDLEEEVGHRAERWPRAAAVLVAARRPASMRMIK